ncbi:hypothetical protein MHA02_27860 [Methylobacterium haplocladii]|uniref:Uncharacterized protein n=1 Tax=Methylobacterium haplocladii TaxID=1176176 RepID=A0A512IRZ0_9HYPH|nr:hypothetical protein MHA02_27860 [Methylobacterium haplocladii]
MRAALDAAPDQTGLFEDLHVFGGGRERHRERMGEFTHTTLTAKQGMDHGAPGRIGEGMEQSVEVGR